MSDYVTKEEHIGPLSHRFGQELKIADATETILVGKRQIGKSETVANSEHTHAILFQGIPGAPTDEYLLASDDFDDDMVTDGMMLADTFNLLLWIRIGGVWRYANLT